MSVRIAIADDHAVVRRGLSTFLEDEEDLNLVGQYADGAEMIEALRHDAPDIALVDLRMKQNGGLDVLRFVKEHALETKIIILAGNITDDEVVEAMRLGAKGIVLKEMAPTLLIRSIRKVARGGTWIEQNAVTRVMERLLDQHERRAKIRSVLTPREIDIVRLVVEGHGNRDVGEALFISERTVKTHLHSIFEKAGVKSRMQLASWARENGLA